MMPQTNVIVASAKITPFRKALQSLRVDGAPVNFREAENGFFSIDLGQEGFLTKPPVADFGGRTVLFKEIGMTPVEIEDQTHSSAYHIPNGTLLIYDPAQPGPKAGFTQISTVEIAPTILSNYSIALPPYMKNAVSLAAGSLA